MNSHLHIGYWPITEDLMNFADAVVVDGNVKASKIRLASIYMYHSFF